MGITEDIAYGFNSDSSNERRDVAILGGVHRKPGCVPHLISLLSDKSLVVQCAAIWALGRIGDSAAVRELCVCLKDVSVVQDAAFALGEIGDPEAIPALQHVLGSSAPSVRYAAACSLSKIIDEDIPCSDVPATDIEDRIDVKTVYVDRKLKKELKSNEEDKV